MVEGKAMTPEEFSIAMQEALKEAEQRQREREASDAVQRQQQQQVEEQRKAAQEAREKYADQNQQQQRREPPQMMDQQQMQMPDFDLSALMGPQTQNISPVAKSFSTGLVAGMLIGGITAFAITRVREVRIEGGS